MLIIVSWRILREVKMSDQQIITQPPSMAMFEIEQR